MSDGKLSSLVMRGALVMLLLRWVVRLLGLVSVIITSRLITPENFGVMGTAGLVVGILATMRYFGGGEVLVRLKALEPSHVHTVWTLQLLMSLPPTFAIYLLADPASGWLNEPRVADVLRVLAFIPVIEALASPAPILLQRDMDFRRLFRLRVLVKLCAVIGTVLLAYFQRDYWALALGQIVASIALVLVSHVFLPYWPTLTLARLRETGSFTFWSFIRNIVVDLSDTIDEFLVRRATTTERFAHYHVSRDLSRVFITELVAQAASPLYSAYARIQDQPDRLRAAVMHAFGASVILLTPISLFIFATSDSMVRLVLGAQWDAAAPYLRYLALGVAAQTLGHLARGVYSVLDRQAVAVGVWSLRTLVMGGAVFLALTLGTPLLVTQVYAATNLTLTFLELGLIFRLLGGHYPVVPIYRGAMLAGLLMLGTMELVPASLARWPVLDVIGKSTLGGLVYGATILLLWRLLRRPAGPEQALIQHMPERVRRLLDPHREPSP